MNNYILLTACFVFGILLRRSGRLPDNAAAALNGFVVHVSLPALTLVYVHELKVDQALFIPVLMPWLMFALGCAFFYALGRLLNLPRATVGALTLTGSLANTSFIGLPMIETFYGPQGLGLGILIDQAGSYLVLSTFGVALASIYAARDSGVTLRGVAHKIARFAPFVAFVLAILLMPFQYPEWLETLLKRLGGTLVPIALVSVGYQLRLSAVRGKLPLLAFGLGFKLFAMPALAVLVFAGLLGARGETLQITVFESAMAPMIGAAIVALDHELDPPLVTLMVGIGIPLSFATVPLWWYLLKALA